MLIILGASVVLFGCGSSFMRGVDTKMTPDESSAVVSFVRPQSFAFGQALSLWEGERFLGMLDAKRMVQVRVDPGEHVFMGRAGNWSYLKANLEAGKHYVVVARLFPADDSAYLSNIGVALVPAASKEDYSDKEVEGWIDGASATEPIPEKTAEYEAEHKADVQKGIADYQAGTVEFAELGPGDNRL